MQRFQSFAKDHSGATLFLIVLVILFCGCANSKKASSMNLPKTSIRVLVADGRITFAPIGESSGMVQSRKYPGVFWTHNDSGDSARLFAIRADGSLVRPDDGLPYDGIQVGGARNHDWEDLTLIDGQLIIADTGNNANKRRDLVLYFLPEPNPYRDRVSYVTAKQPIVYPEQTAFPPEQMNFDNEALFYWDRTLCLLTKNRSDSLTALYALPIPHGFSNQTEMLSLRKTYNLRGMVTAADAYRGRIAVLTYNTVWVFEPDYPALVEFGHAPELFSGHVWWQPIWAKQCESIAFINADTLLIGNEQRDLYQIKLSVMQRLR